MSTAAFGWLALNQRKAGAESARLSFRGCFVFSFVDKSLACFISLLWSTCGLPRKMNIKLALKLTHADPQTYPRFLIVGSHWFSTPIKLGLVWRRCN